MPAKKNTDKTGRIIVKADTHKLIKLLSAERNMSMDDLIECAIPRLQSKYL